MDRQGRQQLHYLALEGDVRGLRERLAAGDDVGLADKQGFTALHFAAQQSQTEAVGALLEAGAAVDTQDRFGNTHAAVACGVQRSGERGDGRTAAQGRR